MTPTPGKEALQRPTCTKQDAAGPSCPGFNPVAQPDAVLFMPGSHLHLPGGVWSH